MAPHCSSMVFTHSTPRADASKKQWCPRAEEIHIYIYISLSLSTFLHGDLWEGNFAKTSVGHFDDKTLQLCGRRQSHWRRSNKKSMWVCPEMWFERQCSKNNGKTMIVWSGLLVGISDFEQTHGEQGQIFIATWRFRNPCFFCFNHDEHIIHDTPVSSQLLWRLWKPDRGGMNIWRNQKNVRNFWPNNNPRLKTFPTNWGCNEKSGGLLILVDMCVYIYIHIYSFVVKNSCWINYHKAINTPNYCHLFNAPSTIIRLINPRLKEPQRQRFTIFTNAALCHLRQQKWQNGSSHEIIPSHAHGAPGLYLYCWLSALAIQPVIIRIILVCVEFATVMNPCHVDFASM